MNDRRRYVVPRPLQPLTRPFYLLGRRAGRVMRSIGCSIHSNPVIVLGNQKSGTTAIAALLGRLTGLPTTLDLEAEIRDPKYRQVRAGTLPMDTLIRRNRLEFSRPIIKEPHLTAFFPELCKVFPEAQWLFIVRDPRDNLRSILNRLQLLGNAAGLDRQQYASVPPVWQLVLDNEWLGIDADHYIDQLAHRWCWMAEVYLGAPERFTLVRYEDFVAAKAETIGTIAEQLGLVAVRDIAGEVDHQFQPAGDQSISRTDFFGEENLDRINTICGPLMRRLEYLAPR